MKENNSSFIEEVSIDNSSYIRSNLEKSDREGGPHQNPVIAVGSSLTNYNFAWVVEEIIDPSPVEKSIHSSSQVTKKKAENNLLLTLGKTHNTL